MNKTELRKVIREEVKREFNQVLPKLIREAIGSVLAKEMRRSQAAAEEAPGVAPSNPDKLNEEIDRPRLAALMGYGDMRPGARSMETPPVSEVAGVPIVEGLAAKEASAGQAHLRDYNAESAVFADSVVPDEAQFVGGVDGGGSVPPDIVAALGDRGKKILDATNNKSNWRPGMPR
jgi:hypothetical protein